MSAPRLLISLLPAHQSEPLLRAVHRLLPPPRLAEVALLLALDPAAGTAALRMRSDDLVVVIGAADAHRTVGVRAGVVPVLWCRDEAEADGVDAQRGTPVVAETLEQLAWELVRRLTGDLSGTAATARDTPPLPTVDADSRRTPSEQAGLLPRPVQRRGAALLPPPWARGVAPTDPAARQSRPPRDPLPAAVPEPVHDHAPPPPSLPTVAPADDDLPRDPVLTPLAALAQMERAPESLPAAATAVFDHDRVRTPIRALPRSPHTGLQRVRSLLVGAGARRRDKLGDDLSALGQGLMRAHSTLVVVGTPKGGPGKTTNAAALGVLGARAVEPHGGSAVLVDANLNNPDSWRQLAIPADAVTVREVVDALNSRALPPNGEFAREARLRVLPERRSAGSEYSAAEISRLEAHLRLRHTLIVVDLPNSLPSLGEGPKEALVAHWLAHADVVVLPLDLGESSFIAAAEMLDAIEEMTAARDGAAAPGLVVPLLLPPDGRRAAAAVPQIANLLNHLRDAGARIVEVPYTVDVQVASHRRQSIVGASSRSDQGFLGVLDAVVSSRSTVHRA